VSIGCSWYFFIKAVEDGFELGFAEQYSTDVGLDVTSFHKMICARVQSGD
jgi:hypothetical protein